MNLVKVSPSVLNGKIDIPPSKSIAHRSIICAALSKSVSKIYPIIPSDDMKATIGAVEAIGAKCEWKNDTLIIDSRELFKNNKDTVNCIESGSTLRFLIPICAAGGVDCTFVGEGRLPQRPIGIYEELLKENGVECKTSGGLPFSIKGQLTSGEYKISGNVSSQFITGLMLALPLLEGDSKIILTSELESEGYVELTIQAMKKYSVEVEKTDYGWFIKGSQNYKSVGEDKVEGDWSQAAFFISLGLLNSEKLEITNLNKFSAQGDAKALELFKNFGGNVYFDGDTLVCSKSKIIAQEIDASQIPDLVPTLAVTAAFANETTRIYGASRLRLKESDRLNSVCEGLNNLGVKVTQSEDELIIYGCGGLKGGNVKGYNDHRIVMAFAIGAFSASDSVIIDDAMSINKSYPAFFDDIIKLGGVVDVLNMG